MTLTLTPAEVDEKQRRLSSWRAEHPGADETLLDRAVTAAIVLDRLRRLDEAAWAETRNEAIARFEQEHEDAIAALLTQLAARPGPTRVRLQHSHLGCARLIAMWADLGEALLARGRWSTPEIHSALVLLGHRPDDPYPDAVASDLRELATRDWSESERLAVEAMVVEELGRLQELQDEAKVRYERSRASAPDRAMPSEAHLRFVVRYEPRWRRQFQEAVRELRQLRTQHSRVRAKRTHARPTEPANAQDEATGRHPTRSGGPGCSSTGAAPPQEVIIRDSRTSRRYAGARESDGPTDPLLRLPPHPGPLPGGARVSNIIHPPGVLGARVSNEKDCPPSNAQDEASGHGAEEKAASAVASNAQDEAGGRRRSIGRGRRRVGHGRVWHRARDGGKAVGGESGGKSPLFDSSGVQNRRPC